MKANTYAKVKTINLDSHIFKQDLSPARSKVPSHLLKTLAQRKRKEPRFKIIERRPNASYQQQQEQAQDKLQPLTPFKISLCEARRNNCSFLSHNNRSKTIYTTKRRSPQTENILQFRRYQATSLLPTNPDQSYQKLNEEEQVFQNYDACELEGTEVVNGMHNKTHFDEQRRVSVNPYTKDEYIYMKNQQMDHMIRIKRSYKFRRVSSITKSYKVGTMQLMPAANLKTLSVKVQSAKPKVMRKCYYSKLSSLAQTKRELEIPPSPWEWGLSEEPNNQVS